MQAILAKLCSIVYIHIPICIGVLPSCKIWNSNSMLRWHSDTPLFLSSGKVFQLRRSSLSESSFWLSVDDVTGRQEVTACQRSLLLFAAPIANRLSSANNAASDPSRSPRSPVFQRQTSALKRLEGTFTALDYIAAALGAFARRPQLSHSLVSEQT